MKLIYTALLGLTIGLGTSYAQTTVVLTPEKDNSIYSENVDNSNALGKLYSGATCSNNDRRALMQFDISNIPSNAVITDARLTVNVDNVSNNIPGSSVYGLYRVTTEWGEGTSTATGQGAAATNGDATWNNAMSGSQGWMAPGGDVVQTASATQSFSASTGDQVFANASGLVDDIQRWVDGTSDNFGWMLIGDESVACSARRMGSKDHGTAPQLEITYTVASNVSNVATTNGIKLYPNPTKDVVNINMGNLSNASVQVFNTIGRLVMEQNNINTPIHTIELPQNAGLYLIKVTANGKETTLKVIKE